MSPNMHLSVVLLLLHIPFFTSALQYSVPKWTTRDQCPTSIKATIPGGYNYHERVREPVFDTMNSIHSALLACPDLTNLDLRVTLLGCSEWPDRWNFPFKLEGGDKYPPLKTLRLEGYKFEERPWYDVRLRSSEEAQGGWLPERLYDWWRTGKMQKYYAYEQLSETQRNKTNLELWFDAMDWSQIETLGLLDNSGQYHFMDKAAPYLKSLKNLEVWGGRRGANNTLDFISNLTPQSLTKLTWINGWRTDVLSPILENHGQSLQHLEIRDQEIDKQPSPAFDKEQLLLLSQKVPKLKHLSLNVHRNGSWPLESFSIIASIPSLETVDVWLDITSDCQRQKPKEHTPNYWELEREFKEHNESLPCQGEDRFQRPFLNERSALEIFKHVRNTRTGEHLVRVTFWAGDWSRPWDGPIYSPPWIEGQVAKIVCSAEGKIEGEAWCFIEAGNEYWKRDF